MSTILVHAGMPKTGSTSIQTWLRENAAMLRAEHGATVVVDGPSSDGDLVAAPYEHGPWVVSNGFLLHTNHEQQGAADPARLVELGDAFADRLVGAADLHGDIIVTAEAFAHPILEGNEPVLAALQRAAGKHRVRVVLYVRPQHDAVEARWRQWGYFNAAGLSEFWRSQLPTLSYGPGIEAATTHAPDVAFEIRPFRRDLLTDGDVVVDFARHACGVEGVAPHTLAANPGLSLDLVLLLAGAPDDVVRAADRDGSGTDWGRRQVTLSSLTAEWDIPVSDQAREVRRAIHALAYRQFAAQNRALAAAQGWAGGEFVPAPEDEVDVTVDDLDRLIEPRIDASTLAIVRSAIRDLCLAREAAHG
ncbi:MAG: hypothetical protein R8F63_00420 [Acidimicrobiales bacterium]|nr:hypothetical protein [Acidimicrobiales bacterium]